MDEGNGYCGCGSEIESALDAAKIANVVVTGAGEVSGDEGELCGWILQ